MSTYLITHCIISHIACVLKNVKICTHILSVYFIIISLLHMTATANDTVDFLSMKYVLTKKIKLNQCFKKTYLCNAICIYSVT